MPIEHLGPRAGTALFLHWIEHYGWHVYLDPDGRMTATIGDDPPAMCQQHVLATLAALEVHVLAILRGLRTVH